MKNNRRSFFKKVAGALGALALWRAAPAAWGDADEMQDQALDALALWRVAPPAKAAIPPIDTNGTTKWVNYTFTYNTRYGKQEFLDAIETRRKAAMNDLADKFEESLWGDGIK